MKNAETSADALLLAGRELWECLAVALTDPFHRARLEKLADPTFRMRVLIAADLYATEFAAGNCGAAELPIQELDPNAIFLAFDLAKADLEKHYREVFGFTLSPKCPPCETEFEPNDEINFRAQQMADVGGFYQAFGWKVSPQNSERLDHISLLSEFYSILCIKEALAREDRQEDTAEICEKARRDFFKDHLGWWLPAFGGLLYREAGSAFYRATARFASALSRAERLALNLPQFGKPATVKPTKLEDDPGCMSCPISVGGGK